MLKKPPWYKRHLSSIVSVVIFVVAVVALFGLAQLTSIIASKKPSLETENLYQLYASQKVSNLELNYEQIARLQNSTKQTIVSNTNLTKEILQIKNLQEIDNYQQVLLFIDPKIEKSNTIITQLEEVEKQQNQAKVSVSTTPQNVAGTATVPILIYHKLPANFDSQLKSLASKGYSTISMAELANFFDGNFTLPKKAVIITFDDGFSDQQKSIELLKKYNMKATYYLIIGGEKSNWCIGILRQAKRCGDSYLNWQEVKQMRDSGLAEIGAHTVDHLNLAALKPTDQIFQIVTSKQVLEKELGVVATTFAYPYGKYNTSAVQAVRDAGFRTAVTTQEGTSLSVSYRLTLPRVRNAFALP